VAHTARDPVESIREIKRGLNVEENFHTLFQHHYPQLIRFFRRKGFDPEDCRDLTQETFVSVYKGLGELRQEEQFESWLFAIAHNIWCSVIEKRSAQKRSATLLSLDEGNETEGRLSLAERIPDQGIDPLRIALDQERLEKLQGAMRHLPQQMNRCVQLRVVHDLSHVEIARAMGISVNTVKAHLHQARNALRRQLSSYFEEIEV